MNKIDLRQVVKNTGRRFLLLGIGLIFLLGCNTNEDIIKKVSLVSPSGYVLAKNMDGLFSLLGIDKENKILEISYMETDKATIAFVSYMDKSENKTTVAIGSGSFNYSADSVNVQPVLRSSEGKVKVSCSGCDNCRVEGMINPDGTMTVKCESSCCTMTIEGAKEMDPDD